MKYHQLTPKSNKISIIIKGKQLVIQILIQCTSQNRKKQINHVYRINKKRLYQ